MPEDRYACPACRMFCGLISPDGRLPAAPACTEKDCPAIAALSPAANHLETVAATILAAHDAKRKRRAADPDEPTPAEAVPSVATCDGGIGDAPPSMDWIWD